MDIKVRGFRVYTYAPEVVSEHIILTDDVKRALQKAKIEEFSKLKVYAVGEQVTDIKVGDLVYVDDNALNNVRTIKIDDETIVLMFSSHDIAHIWVE